MKSVSSSNMNKEETLRNSLLRVVAEAWRFKKAFERVLEMLGTNERRKNLSKLKWFEREITEAMTESGLKINNFEGQPYTAGIPATPINIEEFEDDYGLYVSQTLEPTVLDEDGNVLRSGFITLEKAGK